MLFNFLKIFRLVFDDLKSQTKQLQIREYKTRAEIVLLPKNWPPKNWLSTDQMNFSKELFPVVVYWEAF